MKRIPPEDSFLSRKVYPIHCDDVLHQTGLRYRFDRETIYFIVKKLPVLSPGPGAANEGWVVGK